MFSFTPTRTTQPYQRGFSQPQTPQLAAMQAGRPMFAPNPMDHRRYMEHIAALLRGRQV